MSSCYQLQALHYFPANCTDGSIRLMVGEDYEYYMAETDYDQLYYIDDKLSRGRVEICKGGGYHTSCVDSWDERDASVVCRELGFSPNGEKVNCHVTSLLVIVITATKKSACML